MHDCLRDGLGRNIIHRERFFTEHTFCDRNNRLNQIIRVAPDVLAIPHTAADTDDNLAQTGTTLMLIDED